MKKVLIGFGVVVLLIVLYLGYLGIMPGLSALFGSNKPRDLGISYTQADFLEAEAKGGVDVQVNQSGVTASNSLILTGSHQVNQSFTSAEVTAALNEYQSNWAYYPFSDAQVRINSDGAAELSAYILKDRLEDYARATNVPEATIEAARPYLIALPKKLPIYIKGTASATDNQLDLNLDRVEIMRFRLPQAQLSAGQSEITDFVEDQLRAFNISIDSGRLTGGNVEFKGRLAESISTFSE